MTSTRNASSVLGMVEDESTDERIGRQVALLRGDKLTQAAVAEGMRARGHRKWSQSTVWAVEKGTRPLRLAEAEDLAGVLGTYMYMLTSSPEEVSIGRWMNEAGRIHGEIESLTVEYLKAVDQLRLGIDDAIENGVTLSHVLAEGGGWPEATPERAVELGRFEYEQQVRNEIERDDFYGMNDDDDAGVDNG